MYVFGASGHGKVVISALESRGIHISGVFDDNEELQTCLHYPVKIYNESEDHHDNSFIIAIGDNVIREQVYERLGRGSWYGVVIHEKAIVNDYIRYEEGTVIMASATIQPGTQLGKHVIINTSAVVDHDCIIGDFVHIAPRATLCGGVKVGKGSLVGAGSTVLPGIQIGKNCTVGAGSTVLRNVNDGETVYGVVK
ncbi:acetyltransferase [Echinicola shivajiensis]|uniref:acetyltransferase n=1 Tax=Echinicola shivajiensis TaxID=1035916 RepID=UPI001BFCD040|nr:acetyltransferase [Echinicola shivajiensis]